MQFATYKETGKIWSPFTKPSIADGSEALAFAFATLPRDTVQEVAVQARPVPLRPVPKVTAVVSARLVPVKVTLFLPPAAGPPAGPATRRSTTGAGACSLVAVGQAACSPIRAFGTHDGYNLWEAPDNVSMAAVALAISGGGALSSFETTVLLSVDETLDALRRTQQIQYRAPGG
ncbi:GYD domain-containing protein [Streptomyces nojiriensis]|uniref:GYD domain-containing protein n=1 Tax=Streptomyces nojiriensis TaxID=66374 RepID=UPI002E181290